MEGGGARWLPLGSLDINHQAVSYLIVIVRGWGKKQNVKDQKFCTMGVGPKRCVKMVQSAVTDLCNMGENFDRKIK